MKLSRHWTKDKIIDAAVNAYAQLAIRADNTECELASERKAFTAYREQTTELISELRTKFENVTISRDHRAHECFVLRDLLVMLYNEKA